jgi:phage terminase large subunit-like protein
VSQRLADAKALVLDVNRVCAEAGYSPEINSAFRRERYRDDPLAFALCYLAPHLSLEDGTISLSTIHEAWLDEAMEWGTTPDRDIYVAPRGTGKSTWFFLVIPMWAAATGRIKFAAAFADSATQAEGHLSTFRTELERNVLLRADYPDLCKPARRQTGATMADNRGMVHAKSGFAFAARGIDSGTLGLKVGDQRPDLILMDDIEPGESSYSEFQVEKRLSTVTDVILPMGSANARSVIVGTATMRGSLIHQAVMHDTEPQAWIKDEDFVVHHSLPFTEEGDSVWPQRWPSDWLRGQVGQRSFAKNFLNQPVTLDGEYWTEDDYAYGDLPSVSRRVIAVDPAVTTKRSSDETGIAVVGYSASARKAVVDEAFGVRLKGEPLRARLLDVLARYPDVAEILWERNAGGEMMAGSVLHDMPVRVTTVHNSEKKEVRMERALSYYRRGAVLHARPLPGLEAQQTEFPRGLHDDIGDAVSIALDHLAAPGKRPLRAASR